MRDIRDRTDAFPFLYYQRVFIKGYLAPARKLPLVVDAYGRVSVRRLSTVLRLSRVGKPESGRNTQGQGPDP
jgi:hypothetical protein